ncbi:MAG: DUF6503 family protein, partial [Bacteroidota bacterium]
MKKALKITGLILLVLFLGGLWIFFTPVDLRTDYLGTKISESDYQKGKVLLKEMQDAYGGMDHWQSLRNAQYAQTANWFGKSGKRSGWDVDPQEFEIRCALGTMDGTLTLLNGPREGDSWITENGAAYQLLEKNQRQIDEGGKFYGKITFKNYWFQFPFRISEAPIIAYAGESTVNGETYDLLYATWGSEKANREFDQYMLYIDQKTRMIEWLNFTVRFKFNFIKLASQFDDFKEINGIMAPFSQSVKMG